MNFDELIPNTQELHAIMAHLPVALSVLGLIAIVAALLINTRRDVLRWNAAACYLLLIATGYIAERTGENARAEVSGALPDVIWETIQDHAEMAEKVWIFAIATAVLMTISIFLYEKPRLFCGLLTLCAGIVTAVWVGLTGHHGGTLVYEYGIGIPPDQVVEWRINPPAGGGSPPVLEIDESKLIRIREIDPVEAEAISYTRDVLPIFEELCIECHTPGDLDSEYDMTTVPLVIKGGEKYGASVIPGKPDESTLIQYVRGQLKPQMPEDEMPLLVDEVHILRLWIAAGAKDDTDAASP